MSKSNKGGKGDWKGFFNFYLEENQKNAIKKLSQSGKATMERFAELADRGYKVSATYSVDRGAYFVSCTGGANCPANRGYSLTQAHADFSVAVACVWFICSEVFDWDSWPVESSSDDDFDW